MEHESSLSRDIEQLKARVRVLSYVLGVSIIIIAVVLIYTLPSVIQNNTFRVQWHLNHTKETASEDDFSAEAGMEGDMDMGGTDAQTDTDMGADAGADVPAP